MLPSAWVYILTNKYHTTFYVGITNNLLTRLWEHRMKQGTKSFTAKYNLFKLVFYESFEAITKAIKREKYIKGKTREWKIDLINKMNPEWRDLTDEINKGYR